VPRKPTLRFPEDDDRCKEIVGVLLRFGPSNWSEIRRRLRRGAGELSNGAAEHTVVRHLTHLEEGGIIVRRPRHCKPGKRRGKRGTYHITRRAESELFPRMETLQDIEEFLAQYGRMYAVQASRYLRAAAQAADPAEAQSMARLWRDEIRRLLSTTINVTMQEERGYMPPITTGYKERQRYLPQTLRTALRLIEFSIDNVEGRRSPRRSN
jgi:DNA-binding HxlR family transcriptional regulator